MADRCHTVSSLMRENYRSTIKIRTAGVCLETLMCQIRFVFSIAAVWNFTAAEIEISERLNRSILCHTVSSLVRENYRSTIKTKAAQACLETLMCEITVFRSIRNV